MARMRSPRISFRATDPRIEVSCMGVGQDPELSQEKLPSYP